MRFKLLTLILAILAVASVEDLAAELYTYSGVVTLCTESCDGFVSLAVGSTINTNFEIDTLPNSGFTDDQMGPFQSEIFNPAEAPSGPVGDPVTDNPLLLDSSAGVAASNGTSGSTNAANELSNGQILIEFLVPPFSDNGAFVVYDLATGNGQICLFYTTTGCIAGATEIVNFEGSFTLIGDSDNDGITDDIDNCIDVSNPFQSDADDDGHGNVCDPDLNNDCIVNAVDLGLFKAVFGTSDSFADFNLDFTVDSDDLDIMKGLFYQAPGPSAAGLCGL